MSVPTTEVDLRFEGITLYLFTFGSSVPVDRINRSWAELSEPLHRKDHTDRQLKNVRPGPASGPGTLNDQQLYVSSCNIESPSIRQGTQHKVDNDEDRFYIESCCDVAISPAISFFDCFSAALPFKTFSIKYSPACTESGMGQYQDTACRLTL